jgi:drug/metabolite transporter (DMT)-like permease
MSSTRPTHSDDHENAKRPAVVWAALAIVYLVWGSTYLAIRICVHTLPPFVTAGLRFGLAGLLLGALIALRRGFGTLRVTRRQFFAAALVGLLLLGGGNGMVVVAESGPPGRAVPSGIAALLVATVPLLVVVLRSVTGDRPGWSTITGVLLGFIGLGALIASRGGGGVVPVGGALVVVAAATCWSLGSFLSTRLPLPPDPFVASVYEMVVGGVVMGLAGVFLGEPRRLAHGSTSSWLALGYLLVAGSLIAFTAYVWLLRHAPISLTATYAYVNPVVAVFLGALIVNESVTPAILLSGAVILLGVALVVSTERPNRRTSQRSEKPELAVAGAPRSVAAPPLQQPRVDSPEER